LAAGEVAAGAGDPGALAQVLVGIRLFRRRGNGLAALLFLLAIRQRLRRAQTNQRAGTEGDNYQPEKPSEGVSQANVTLALIGLSARVECT